MSRFMYSMLASLVLLAASTPARAQVGAEANPEPRWWKGNLHTHTLWSDGNDFPEMVVGWYADNGYHFLALSDHNILSRGQRWMPIEKVSERSRGEAMGKYLARFGDAWVERRVRDGIEEVRLKPIDEYRTLFESPSRFLLIEGEEITGSAGNGRAIHMNAANLGEFIEWQGGETVPEVISNTLRAAHEQSQRLGRPILVHVNHPNYKWGVTAEDLASIVEERFFEVWNGVDGDNDPGDASRPSTDEIWDIANTLRIAGLGQPPLFGLATDDSHNYHWKSPRAFPGRAWVMVRSRYLTPEHIIDALRKGNFYASTGVTLDSIVLDESGVYSFRIVPEQGETYRTLFIGTRRGVRLEGRPRLDERGRVLETTLDYTTDEGPQIGEILAEVEGTNPSYRLRGDELYVRAIVISSGVPEFASRESSFKKAWTQPVGWRGRVADRPFLGMPGFHTHEPSRD